VLVARFGGGSDADARSAPERIEEGFSTAIKPVLRQRRQLLFPHHGSG
jgi:hypothetical protein